MYVGHFKIKDFEETSHNPFINPRKDTNILNYLIPDEKYRYEITKDIILSLSKTDKLNYKTHMHIRWAMESIGYAFSLPIEFHSTIRGAIEIYRNWLNLDGQNKRPACFHENEEFYQQDILSHFSLLFVERSGETKKHAELCGEVLVILRDFVRIKQLSENTWNVLLKIFLLFSQPLLASISALTQELCSLLFKTMFEIWIRSNTRNTELWEELNIGCRCWVDKHGLLVEQWYSVALGFTQRVINIMYGEGSNVLQIIFPEISSPTSHSPETVQLDFTPEQTIFFWYRIKDLMIKNTSNKLPSDPMIHQTLAKNVAKLTDCFLDLCNKRHSSKALGMPDISVAQFPAKLEELTHNFQASHYEYIHSNFRLPAPSANGILDLFGEWLFFHAKVSESNYEIGKLDALAALCKIFSKAAGPVREDYLIRFYNIVYLCIQSYRNFHSSSAIGAFIVKNSKELFTREHKGIRYLLSRDALPTVIEMYLCDKDSNNLCRKPCLYLLSTFISLPQYFLSNAPVCQAELSSKFTQHWMNLDEQVYKIVMKSLKIESNSDSFHILIWSMVVYAYTIHNSDSKLLDIVAGLVKQLEHVDCINDIKRYEDLVSAISVLPVLLTGKSIVSEDEIAYNIISALCVYILKLKGKNEKAVDSLLYAIMYWLISFPKTFELEQIRAPCLSAILQVNNPVSEYVLKVILDNLGRDLQPVSYGTTGMLFLSLTSNFLERHPIDGQGKHYMLDKSVLFSIYDISTHISAGEEALIIIRNKIGRYIWRCKLKYRLNVPKQMDTVWNLPEQPAPSPPRKSSIDEEDYLFLKLDPEDQAAHQIVRENLKLQKELISNYQGPMNFEVLDPLNNQKHPVEHEKADRLLLGTLGLLGTAEIERLLVVDTDLAGKYAEELDSIPQKQILILPILYISYPECSEYDSLSNKNSFSDAFKSFIREIGARISKKNSDFEVFRSTVPYVNKYGAALYTSGLWWELISISPAISKMRESSIAHIIGKNRIALLWNQRANDPYSLKLPNLLEHPILNKISVILVTPISEGLLKINVFRRSEGKTGPLLNDMVISHLHLPKLVIATVLNMKSPPYSLVNNTRDRIRRLTELAEKAINLERTKNGKLSAILSYALK